MQALQSSKPGLKVGLCLVSLSTVLFEIILSRLFSVSSGYHFAFMIVSMAMFGMTLGALITLAFIPLDLDKSLNSLKRNSALLAISIPGTYCLQHYFYGPLINYGPYFWIAAVFLIYAIPFYFSGICISLCLTRFKDIGKLYAFDLLGAGLSCIILVLALTYTDAKSVLVISSLAAAISSVLFSGLKPISAGENKPKLPVVTIVALLAVGIWSFVPEHNDSIICAEPIEYIKWSPVGRVIATNLNCPPITWSITPLAADQKPVPQKGLYIDFGAFTCMTSGKAPLSDLIPMRRDITALGNFLRPDGSLFVIGVGGGRDIFTGLLFGQKHIDGVEVNPAIVSMLKNKYSDFNDHLAQKPGVNIVNDEARNWLARSKNKYDVIQCSLVDTWAASSSGAFMLTENTLYTTDAFINYAKHLSPRGILSFLRWGDESQPDQLIRMLSLVKSGLKSQGVSDLGKHIMLISAPSPVGPRIGAVLASLSPFSEEDYNKVLEFAKENGYKPLFVYGHTEVEPFATFLKNDQAEDFGAPSDDRPFFFTPVKLTKNESQLADPALGKGFALIMFTLILSATLVLFTIIIPSWLGIGKRIGSLKTVLCSALFFSALGLGFMFVEVGMIQRLTTLLGNPTYGLSIVLFALLLASGLGSLVVQYLLDSGRRPQSLLLQALVITSILVFAANYFSMQALISLEASELLPRILASIALVSIPGFFMGFCFPLGMTYFGKFSPEGGAWFWAVNGATSVLGSVLAAAVSIAFGIKYTIGTGAAIYLIALLSLL